MRSAGSATGAVVGGLTIVAFSGAGARLTDGDADALGEDDAVALDDGEAAGRSSVRTLHPAASVPTTAAAATALAPRPRTLTAVSLTRVPPAHQPWRSTPR